MDIDCTDYKNCPNQNEIVISTSENLKIGIVGCWGVYCQNDKITFNTYSLDNNRAEILWNKENLIYQDFISQEDKIRGQLSMTETLKRFQPYTSLFLAGDNIYEYSEISDVLKNELNQKIDNWNKIKDKSIEKFKTIFYHNDLIKKDRSSLRELYKNLDVSLQFSKSFEECFKNLDVGNYFLALGNHDIETCNILNFQMKKEYLPGSYYNVIYKDENENDILNVFVLDTNLFEDLPTDCKGDKYLKQMIDNQIDWFRNKIHNTKSPFNIVVGHIPYKAIGHKTKQPFIYNKNLQPIFDIIKEANHKKPLIQAYFCADEHDQQVLYDRENKLHLIIIGSGGTTLDKIFGYDKDDKNNSKNNRIITQILLENGLDYLYSKSEFGFSILNIDITKKLLDIEIFDIISETSFRV